MKANVLYPFKDKENNKKNVVKDSIFEASEERIKELQAKGYLGAAVEEEKEPEKDEKKPVEKKPESKPKKKKAKGSE